MNPSLGVLLITISNPPDPTPPLLPIISPVLVCVVLIQKEKVDVASKK
jgi:hypothetical protein